MKRSKTILLFALGCIFMFSQCKKKKDDDPQVQFDKRPIMVNLADNYIIPAYSDLQTKMNTLELTWNDFNTNQTVANFDLLKDALTSVTISFHRAGCIRLMRRGGLLPVTRYYMSLSLQMTGQPQSSMLATRMAQILNFSMAEPIFMSTNIGTNQAGHPMATRSFLTSWFINPTSQEILRSMSKT